MERVRPNPRRKRKHPGKGAAHERQMCRMLSEWVSRGKRQDLFWRSAMSGGRASIGRKKGAAEMGAIAGDIVATDAEGFKLLKWFCFECKFYADIGIAGLFYGHGGLILKWWEKHCLETPEGRIPVILCKENNRPILWVTTSSGHFLLCQHILPKFPALAALLPAGQFPFVILAFDDVMTKVDPSTLLL
jgi:hypothetical protein